MPSGRSIGPEIEVAIHRFRRDYPGWSQQRIADEIKKRFGVAVDRSTVSVRLNQGTRAASEETDAEDPAQAERSDHWPALRETALEVKNQLSVSVPQLLGLPYHFWPSSTGTLVINGSTVQLAAEADPLFGSLKQHLLGQTVWGLLSAWKQQVLDLQAARAKLRERVAVLSGMDAWPLGDDKATGTDSQRRAKAFDGAVVLVAFEHAIGARMPDGEYAVPRRPGGIWNLEWRRASSYIVIGSSRDRGSLDALRDLHAALPTSIAAGGIAELFRVLEDQERAIGAELVRISKMATFAGRCSLWLP